MSLIRITRTHNLGLDDARAAADRVADDLREAHGIRTHWEGNTLMVRGTGLRGELSVSDIHVNVRVKLRLLMLPLKGTLEREINEQLNEHLHNGA